MSEKRYKGVKSGNCLEIFCQARNKNVMNYKIILSNNLYLDNNIEKESKKLQKIKKIKNYIKLVEIL